MSLFKCIMDRLFVKMAALNNRFTNLTLFSLPTSSLWCNKICLVKKMSVFGFVDGLCNKCREYQQFLDHHFNVTFKIERVVKWFGSGVKVEKEFRVGSVLSGAFFWFFGQSPALLINSQNV